VLRRQVLRRQVLRTAEMASMSNCLSAGSVRLAGTAAPAAVAGCQRTAQAARESIGMLHDVPTTQGYRHRIAMPAEPHASKLRHLHSVTHSIKPYCNALHTCLAIKVTGAASCIAVIG